MVGCSLGTAGEELLGQRGGLAHATSPSARRWGSRCFTPGRTGSPEDISGRQGGRSTSSATQLTSLGSQGPADPRPARRRWRLERRAARGHGGRTAARRTLRLRRPRGPDDRLPVSPPAANRGRDLGHDADDRDDGPTPRAMPRADLIRLPPLFSPAGRRAERLDGRDTGERAGGARLRAAPDRASRAPTDVPAGPLGTRTFDDEFVAPSEPLRPRGRRAADRGLLRPWLPLCAGLRPG